MVGICILKACPNATGQTFTSQGRILWNTTTSYTLQDVENKGCYTKNLLKFVTVVLKCFSLDYLFKVDVLLKPHLPYRHNLSRVMRKPVFGVSDQVRHKLDCTATVDG